MTGKFIVLYGSNNLGKSEQVKRLGANLLGNGLKAVNIKYPIYDTESGRIINRELREQRTMSDRELQQVFALNRYDYESDLIKTLESGMYVIAEDYKHTGISWGIANGISKEDMLEMNKDQLDPDMAILLDGERFTGGIEKGHRYEDGGKWNEARKIHLEFASELNWEVVNANSSMETVEREIWSLVTKKFALDNLHAS